MAQNARQKIKRHAIGLQVYYRLDGIAVGKFSYELPKTELTADTQFDYQIIPNISYKISDELIFVALNIVGLIVETNQTLVLSETVFAYKVQNLKAYVKNPEDPKDLVEGFTPTLINMTGVAVSTMRGILHEKLSGTPMSIKVLPVINPNVFFKPQE